jgi:hypothetical protein
MCPTCGANYATSPARPVPCGLWEDECQWVPPDRAGSKTMDELTKSGYGTEVRQVEPDLVGTACSPPSAWDSAR